MKNRDITWTITLQYKHGVKIAGIFVQGSYQKKISLSNKVTRSWWSYCDIVLVKFKHDYYYTSEPL